MFCFEKLHFLLVVGEMLEQNILALPELDFLSASSSEARASSHHFFCLFFCFFFLVFLSLDFHKLWYSVMSISLSTEVKQQWAMLVLGLVTTSVHYLCF